MRGWRRLRRPWRLLALALLALPILYLAAANLFLNTAFGPWFVNWRPSGRPTRVHLDWGSGWSLWPGRFAVRRLTVRGEGRNVLWTAQAEEGRGRVAFGGFLRREVLIEGFEGEGVRVTIDRRRLAPGEPAPDPAPPRPNPWRVRLPGIALARVEELSWFSFSAVGEGEARGSFEARGGEVRVDDGLVRLAAGRLLDRDGADPAGAQSAGTQRAGTARAGAERVAASPAAADRELAREFRFEAEGSLAPFRAREHPGVEALDFFTGSVRASGEVVADLAGGAPAPAPPGSQPLSEPGSFAADLRAEAGRLQPGSRFALTARRAYPLTLDASVEPGGDAGDRLRVEIDAQDFRLGAREDAPPLLASRLLHIATATAETRASRLFGRAQEMRGAAGPPAASLPGEFEAEGLRLDLRGSRFGCALAADRARGRIDLGALFRRHLALDGMHGEGATARLEEIREGEPPAPRPSRLWSLAITDARFTGVREIGAGELRLAGEAQAAASFSFDPATGLEVQRAAFTLPRGQLLDGEATAARRVTLSAEGSSGAVDLSQPSPVEALAAVSATAKLEAEVPSLGFLRSFLRGASYLGLDGKGRLSAELKVEKGRLVPGTRLAVKAAQVEARILASRAEGRGTIEAEVREEAAGSRLALTARLDRFAVHDDLHPAYLRGQDFVLRAFSADALRLGAPVSDLTAEVELPDAAAPDLTVFDSLLPPAAGISILDGSGKLHLKLAIRASHAASGEISFASERAHIAVQDLEIAGRLALAARLSSPDLRERRFDLDGTRLDLDPVVYSEVGEEASEEIRSWWARAELADASVVWGRPLRLEARVRVAMKDTGLLLALFSRRRNFLRWFEDALLVEDVTAQGRVRLDGEALAVDALKVEGGDLEMASRLRFSRAAKDGDLFLRHGRFAVGIELREGKRDFKILRPREWLESWWRE